MGSLLIKILQFCLGHHGWVRFLLTAIARFGFFLYILYGFVEWFRPGSLMEQLKRRHALLYCLFSVIIGSMISFLIGLFWHRPRPFVGNNGVVPLIHHKANASFPSNHSMNSFSVALQLLRGGKAAGLFFLPWSLAIGVSRIYSGVHYLTDVLAGYLLGFAACVIVMKSKWFKQWADTICYGYAVIEKFVQTWWRL